LIIPVYAPSPPPVTGADGYPAAGARVILPAPPAIRSGRSFPATAPEYQRQAHGISARATPDSGARLIRHTGKTPATYSPPEIGRRYPAGRADGRIIPRGRHWRAAGR